MFNSTYEIEAANKKAGLFFFEDKTLKFFKSIVYPDVFDGQYFITSEKGPHGPRAFSVRRAHPDGRIETMAKFNSFSTKARAIAYIKELVRNPPVDTAE